MQTTTSVLFKNIVNPEPIYVWFPSDDQAINLIYKANEASPNPANKTKSVGGGGDGCDGILVLAHIPCTVVHKQKTQMQLEPNLEGFCIQDNNKCVSTFV